MANVLACLPRGARVAVIRLRSLGDTVLMTPALAAAKRLPNCKVGVVVETPFHEVLVHNPNVDRLFVLDRNRNNLSERIRSVAAIRSFAPHLAIDLHGGTTSAWMTFFSKAARRVGYAASRNAFLYNLRVPVSSEIWGKKQLHTVEHQLSPLKHLGFPVDPLPPVEISLLPGELLEGRRKLEELGVAEPFVLVHPAAAFDTKQWPAEHFATVCRDLSRSGMKVVLTAGPGEEAVLHRIRDLGAGSASVLAPLPLRLFSAVASLSALYIGNDTGATHIAAAFGRKIIVIFGSSDDSVWYPWQTQHELIRHRLPCVPCPGYRCLHYKEPLCIQSVSPEAVIHAARSLYAANQQVTIN